MGSYQNMGRGLLEIAIGTRASLLNCNGNGDGKMSVGVGVAWLRGVPVHLVVGP